MGIKVRAAREASRRWVLENAAVEQGFRGVFYHGSTGWLPDDAVLPATSVSRRSETCACAAQMSKRSSPDYGT